MLIMLDVVRAPSPNTREEGSALSTSDTSYAHNIRVSSHFDISHPFERVIGSERRPPK